MKTECHAFLITSPKKYFTHWQLRFPGCNCVAVCQYYAWGHMKSFWRSARHTDKMWRPNLDKCIDCWNLSVFENNTSYCKFVTFECLGLFNFISAGWTLHSITHTHIYIYIYIKHIRTCLACRWLIAVSDWNTVNGSRQKVVRCKLDFYLDFLWFRWERGNSLCRQLLGLCERLNVLKEIIQRQRKQYELLGLYFKFPCQ